VRELLRKRAAREARADLIICVFFYVNPSQNSRHPARIDRAVMVVLGSQHTGRGVQGRDTRLNDRKHRSVVVVILRRRLIIRDGR